MSRLIFNAFTNYYTPYAISRQVLAFIEDPKTLARASQVSKQWHALLNDDLTWKKLCEKHSYRRLSGHSGVAPQLSHLGVNLGEYGHRVVSATSTDISVGQRSTTQSGFTSEITSHYSLPRRRPKPLSYKSHFKQRYMVETAWRSGGKAIARHITPDQGVVTSLHLTPNYIVVALDNAKIHVFAEDGRFLRTLSGHVMGVWAMVPWDDVLVSGGCDRDVRVWNMATG